MPTSAEYSTPGDSGTLGSLLAIGFRLATSGLLAQRVGLQPRDQLELRCNLAPSSFVCGFGLLASRLLEQQSVCFIE
jgi:hypothetical protein